MNAWAVNPTWQNFSSLVREAATASAVKTGMELSHHLTASLYFGVAALEAFLNERMRESVKSQKSEEEIFDVLRKSQIIAKLKKWPEQILGVPLALGDEVMELLVDFNDIRNDLTHPKTHGHDIYRRLETIDPTKVVAAVAEYIVKYHQAAKTRYPYWVFGWNYLNPRPDSYEIFIINDQQFSFSLQTLGFQVPAANHFAAEAWSDCHLGTFDGYLAVKAALDRLSHCERKLPHFPHRPVLCRCWWMKEHQQTCGNVTKEAIALAKRLDAASQETSHK